MPRKGPRPCVCGHPKSWHTVGFGWCWLPPRPPQMVPRYCRCHGYREVRRTEPLRADRRESELARRLREQYGPLSAALSQPAPPLPLQEEERELVRTVIRPALKAGYRLSSDDSEVQAIIDEERQAAPRWEEPNVTGDQLLREIDSLARARHRRGGAGPDVPVPEAASTTERCSMRRWEEGYPPERCDREEGHDGPHLFLPSPPVCGAPSRGSGHTCALEPGHGGRHQTKFMTPTTVSWSDEPPEPEEEPVGPCRDRYPWALTWSADPSPRFCQLPKGHAGSHHVQDDGGTWFWYNADAPSPVNEVI